MIRSRSNTITLEFVECRRRATVDHRSRASEYEWSSRTSRHGVTLLRRRNLQEGDVNNNHRETTRSQSILDFTGPAVFRGLG